MDYPLFTKLAAEFFGTAILMIFGNGSVANVELKNTKGKIRHSNSSQGFKGGRYSNFYRYKKR